MTTPSRTYCGYIKTNHLEMLLLFSLLFPSKPAIATFFFHYLTQMKDTIVVDYEPVPLQAQIMRYTRLIPKYLRSYITSTFPIFQWIHCYNLSVSPVFLFLRLNSLLMRKITSGSYRISLRVLLSVLWSFRRAWPTRSWPIWIRSMDSSK